MQNSGEHPGDEAWLDLACHACSSETAAALEQHLLTGCAECRKIYDLWTSAVQIAAKESAYEAPAGVIRAIKSFFPLRRKASFLDRLAVVASLVYDSMREPLPAGVRSSHSTARLLLHETADYAIDLRLEVEAEGSQWLTGQIVKKGERPEYTAGTGVVLLDADKQAVAQTVANQSGEFQVAFPAQESITAYLDVPDGSLIGIKIPVAGNP